MRRPLGVYAYQHTVYSAHSQRLIYTGWDFRRSTLPATDWWQESARKDDRFAHLFFFR